MISDAGKKLMEEWYPEGKSTCADCGRTNKAGEMFWGKRGLTTDEVCRQCRDAEEKKAKVEQAALYASGEDTPEHTGEITCPWCGYEYHDSWEDEDDNDKEECPDCGGVFKYTREVEVTYSSERVSPPEGYEERQEEEC